VVLRKNGAKDGD